ncbi:MAG: hypothetical protein AAF417_20785 [Pseudomonadota bacterium]
MPGPGGAKVRKTVAEQEVAKDWSKHNSDRARKYVGAEKAKIATRGQVRDGQGGNLTQAYGKESGQHDVKARAKHSTQRAQKYVSAEKAKIATREQMREGRGGNLTRAHKKGLER